MLDRRAFLALAGGSLLAAPRDLQAQPADGSVRVGWLGTSRTAGDPRIREAFVQAMRELGYVEGRTLRVEYRYSDGKPERFPSLAAELVALKVDLIVTASGTAAALAARQATSTLPIVFHAVGDPVAEGLVQSLARPGGNVTGLSAVAPELLGKSVELLKQAVPPLKHLALLLKPDAMPDEARKERVGIAETTAGALGMRLLVVEARSPDDFDRAFAEMTRTQVAGLIVLGTPVFDAARRRLVELAARSRLPAIYSWRLYVEAGGLISYGPDLRDLARRAATYVDKILKGAKPGDLPVEQPTKFELVINLKTAKPLGLRIPPSLLGRADEVLDQ